ncbi:type VI secretion system tube protein TssD [Pseudomonas lundensis]|uniref:type VI secretion system tube protein TssD n=1 Tax=Pseudomonas lundensis TaxID=86185 RepID=UPI003BA12265
MANQGYRTITGNAQGVISAGCSTQESIGNTYQTTHTDEIMVPPYSHNMTNVGNINKQTHHPIPTTKNVNKSSPLLAQALSIREEINRIISFYPALPFGKLEKLYSISINDGIFADLTLEIPYAILLHDLQPQNMSSSVIEISRGPTILQVPADIAHGEITNEAH